VGCGIEFHLRYFCPKRDFMISVDLLNFSDDGAICATPDTVSGKSMIFELLIFKIDALLLEFAFLKGINSFQNNFE